MSFDLYTNLIIDGMILVTFLWTLFQEWRHHRQKPIATELPKITALIDKIKEDIDKIEINIKEKKEK